MTKTGLRSRFKRLISMIVVSESSNLRLCSFLSYSSFRPSNFLFRKGAARISTGCDGVAGDRDQGNIARVDEACRKHGVGRLASDAVVDLSVGINLHIEAALHEPRRCLFEFGNTVVRIAAIFRLIDFLCHQIPNRFVCHRIVFTNAKVQEFTTRMVSQCFPLCTFDFFELIDFGVFSVIRTADSVGKKRLKIRIGSR